MSHATGTARQHSIDIRNRVDKRDARGDAASARHALFETVFSDSPDGILAVDLESGEIVEANRAVRHHLGVEPRALTGTRLDALELRAGDAAPLLEAVRAHGAFSAERRLRRIDGSACLMHVRAAAAPWEGREVVIVTLRDVRDRKRAEERYRSIFDNAIEGIFQTTADGRYLNANPALARMYGYPSPAALIDGLTDIAGQLYLDPARRAEFRRLLEAEDAVNAFESQIRRRDGSVIWISENARAVRDERGVLRFYEGTVMEITKRKLAEARQRDEEEVARALADFGREMMAAIDSPQILGQLCRLSAAALGCDWAHTFLWQSEHDAYVPVSSSGTPPAPPPTLPRAALGALIEILEQEDVVVADAASAARLPAPLAALHAQCAGALYFAVRRGGACVGVLMGGYRAQPDPFTDVHRRIARGIAHLASVALEHARVLEELARANQVKSEFLATMSHELRTPLHIIIGYNDLLREPRFGVLSADQDDMVARVSRSAHELLDLINATLDLSRIEAGTLPLDLGTVPLPEFLAQLDEEVRELLRERPQLRLEWRVAPDLPSLATDAGKLKVILKNLIHNAIKFTDCGRITVTAAAHPNGVELTVADTGIGIAPEALPIIFEPFRQVDGSMTRRHGGVGLGLHVVKRLVALLGGTVGVASTPGEGTTFRVWLPRT